MNEMMTTQQVAERAGVTVSAVQRWIETGRLVPAFKLPGRTGAYLFDPAALEQLLSSATDVA